MQCTRGCPHCLRSSAAPTLAPGSLPQAVAAFAATVSYLSYVLLLVLFAFKLAKVGLCMAESGAPVQPLEASTGSLATQCAGLIWKRWFQATRFLKQPTK